MNTTFLEEALTFPEITDFGAHVIPDELWEKLRAELEKKNKNFGIPLFHSPSNPSSRIRGKEVSNSLWGGTSAGYFVKESEYPE